MSPRYKGKKKIQSVSKTPPSLPILHPHAAGIDIGAREIYVAVPPGGDSKPVRAFATFTDDLHALRDWLKECGVTSVAMESTGVYWIPLFQILEAAGFEVCLVNARHCKNLPGRKTDVQDCQWLQYLHSVGLLRGSFRPPETVCAVRSLLRHRDGLVRTAATCVHRLHKALTQMNIQLQHVIADVTGVTGLAILEAILAGERDPVVLAKLKDGRIRASTDTIAKSLRGDWRAEHLFTLRQTLATWQHYQGQITACDEETARLLRGFAAKVDVAAQPLPPRTSTHKSPQKNEPRFEAREELYRTCGVDLTQVPGFQSGTALVLLAELGPDFAERFPTAKHFGSWLGLCPDNRITGGKIMSSSTRDVKSRAATALRLAAQCLNKAQNYFGDLYRRWKARLGTPKAITAMAHKLARILWHLFKHREAFNPEVFRKEEEKMKRKKLARLHYTAAALGLKLVPAQ
jgi:transposase